MNNAEKRIDPVCLMSVAQGDIVKEYQGISYWFCSQQCQDRFESNPGLYIGGPGKPAPKQQGKTVLRKRTLILEEAVPDDIGNQVKKSLGSMMGIVEISIHDKLIIISYDLLQITIKQIEDELQQCGQHLVHDWGARIKRAFIHYKEDTELDNLEHQDESHGCHH